MGELRKKVGMRFLQILNFVFIIFLTFSLAVVLQYRLIEKTTKTDMDFYIQYFVYFLFLLSFIFFCILYLKSKAMPPIALYQNGIVLKRRGETIKYEDIATFYFIPKSEKNVRYLIVEKANNTRILIDADYVGDDFIDYFQKDYMMAFTDKSLEKIRNGSRIMFGILSKKQNILLKLFKTKNTVRRLEFEDKFYIDKDYFVYKDIQYSWDNIDIDYDIQDSKIEIKNLDNIILSTYFSWVEKGEFAFNLMDYIIKEYNLPQIQVIQDNNISTDDVQNSNIPIIKGDDIQILDNIEDI